MAESALDAVLEHMFSDVRATLRRSLAMTVALGRAFCIMAEPMAVRNVSLNGLPTHVSIDREQRRLLDEERLFRRCRQGG